MENKKDMKLLTALIAILFIYLDVKWNIRNGIVLAQLLFLVVFYFGGLRATRTLLHRRKKRTALRSDRGYRNPKEIKTWQSYQSNTSVQRSKYETYWDKI